MSLRKVTNIAAVFVPPRSKLTPAESFDMIFRKLIPAGNCLVFAGCLNDFSGPAQDTPFECGVR